MNLEELVERHQCEPLRSHLSDPDPLARLVSVASLIYTGNEDLSDDLINEYKEAVVDTIHDRDSLSRRFTRVVGDNLNQILILPLGEHYPGAFSTLVPFFWESWRESDQYYECAHAAIALTFPPTISDASPPVEYLDDLASLTTRSAIWECDGDWPGLLESRGLPSEKDTFHRWIESHSKP